MIGNIAAPQPMSMLQVQAIVREIRQTSMENTSKVMQVHKPHLSRPLNGSDTREAVNLYA
ncbi:MAG: hypothetical protein U9N45_02820 [Gemmatimonadota bacterium]|nr:hypothetical protein [Gemmatimonadota bacterium]